MCICGYECPADLFFRFAGYFPLLMRSFLYIPSCVIQLFPMSSRNRDCRLFLTSQALRERLTKYNLSVGKVLYVSFPEMFHCSVISFFQTLRKKSQYLQFFWSVFSRILTVHGEIYGKKFRISPYSLRMRENTEQKNSEYGQFSRSENNTHKIISHRWPLPIPFAHITKSDVF